MGAVKTDMELAEFIFEVAAGYDRYAGMDTPTQRLIRNARSLLTPHAPVGIKVMGRGGQFKSPTSTPWVGFFDPDETEDPKRGIYAAYLFAEDLQSVSLSLQQGITDFEKQVKPLSEARAQLNARATAIRGQIPPAELMGFFADLDLASNGKRQKSYEAANIAALRYQIASLPSEAELRTDLVRTIDLLQTAIEVNRQLGPTVPAVVSSPGPPAAPVAADPLRHFKPKSDADYLAHIVGRKIVKSRRHETLVNLYEAWAKAHGWKTSTEHPKDLVLRQGGEEWLVEAKVLNQGKAAIAVREALAQLFEYRHFKTTTPGVRLLALFNEPVGDGFVTFLESCGIASVWRSESGWTGSTTAMTAGLARP